MSGLPLTRKFSYSVAVPQRIPSPREVLHVPEDWRFHTPSSFGFQPTSHSAAAPRMGTRGRDLVKLTPTSLGLTAWGTSHLNVHGAVNSMTPVHKPWHDGKPQHCPEMEDWQKRPGYGKTPKYLQRQRTVFMDSALSQEPPPSPPADASMNGGMNSARTLASSRGSLSPFEKSSLAYSEGTIRLIEHPVKWQRTVQQNMSSTFQPDSLSRNTSAMCCTYGLHPAFPRSPRTVPSETNFLPPAQMSSRSYSPERPPRAGE